MTDYDVPSSLCKSLDDLIDWRRNRAETAGRHSNVHVARHAHQAPRLCQPDQFPGRLRAIYQVLQVLTSDQYSLRQ